MKTIKAEIIDDLAPLFIDVFNSPPWNESWSIEQAKEKLLDIINTPRFYGMAEYSGDNMVGLIMGHGEQCFDGIHFHILEFCVARSMQGKGIGSRMLDEFTECLYENGICNIYLLTMRGNRTEGFYQKSGFKTSEYMCLMSK